MLAAFRLGDLRPGQLPAGQAGTPQCPDAQRRFGGRLRRGHRTAVEAAREGTALKRFLLVDDDPEVPAADDAHGWERWSEFVSRAEQATWITPRHSDDPPS
jgi:hypothetical protein